MSRWSRRAILRGLGGAAALAGAGPARAAPPSLAIAIFDSPGTSRLALVEAELLLAAMPGFAVHRVDGRAVRAGALDRCQLVVFTGGSGSRQGKSLGDEGRQRVRDFVASGGGYVGICAGAYLAMQGEEEFFKLRIVAGRNGSGDFWKRGVAPVRVLTDEGSERVMHYANGPVMVHEPTDGLAAPHVLASFIDDRYAERHGTSPGTMRGTAAITCSSYGRGRVLLFSPNPCLGDPDPGVGSLQRAMMVEAAEWVAQPEPIPADVSFSRVFDGVDPRRAAALRAELARPAADPSRE